MKATIFILLSTVLIIFFGCNPPFHNPGFFTADTIVYEGRGIDELEIGDPSSEITALLGECPEKSIYGTTTWWNHRSKYNIDFLVNNTTNLIVEFRFNEGFPGKTENDICIGSELTEVITAHGGANAIHTVATVDIANSNPNGSDKILYRVSSDNITFTEYKFIDSARGICYWMDASEAVIQICVF